MIQSSESYNELGKNIDFFLVRRLSKKIDNYRNQIIFRLLLEHGLDIEDIVNLSPKNYEFTKSLLHGPKQKIKLPLDLSLLINKIIDSDKPHIFFSKRSDKLSTTTISNIVKSESLALLNVQLTPRDLKNLNREKNPIKKRESLSKKQVEKISSVIDNINHKVLFNTIIETGCSLNELINIKKSDVSDCKIKFGGRVSHISKNLSLQISEIKSNSPYLFSSRQSPKLSDKRVFQLIKKYSKLAGIHGVNLRILRTTAIALMFNYGLNSKAVTIQTGIVHLESYNYGVIVSI